MAQARPNSRSPLGMPFPYQLALPAVVYKDLFKALKECKTLNDRTGATYFQQLPMYTAALPYHWELYPEDMTRFLQREITEPAIKRQFEKEGLINWSTSLPTLHPLVTTGDGNCLLHAAALYMWGIEDSELFLRTSLWESMVNGIFSDKNMARWQAERSSADQAAMSFEFRYNTKEWNEEYDMLKTMAAPIVDDSGYDLPYKSLEEFHIYALANMLRRPIMIISNDKIRNLEGASLQPQSVSGLYLPLDWDPSLCCKFPIVLGFYHSHFFPLVHTAPEDEKDELDLMVPLIIHNELAKVHFTLPGEDPLTLITDYLQVDNFIHCPKNRETAVGLNGAKLSCANMGRNYSVWVPYFDLAETNLRIYNEGEYNPGSATESEGSEIAPEPTLYQEEYVGRNTPDYQGGSGYGDISQQYQQFPPTARPSERKQGQCKTPACPYQQSLCTGDYCVECHNKGQREKCKSVDCLNKADVGLEGFCKVCHDGNRFQQASAAVDRYPPRGSASDRGIPSGSPPSPPDQDRFRPNVDDLNSIAVDMVVSGMEKCILPECQMTGNPNTADMCEGCFKAHMDMEKELGRSTRRQEDEEFVMVNNQGEEDRTRRAPSDIANRREALSNKMVNDQREEERIPRRVDSSERVPSDIVNRREALLNKLGMDDRSRSQPRQSPPERRQDVPPQQMLPRQMPSQQMRSAPAPSRVPVLTVKKDLCATPGCHGVRLKNTDLCRACKEDKKGSTERPRDTGVVRSEPQRQPHTPYQEPPRKCKIRKCDQSAAPPDFKYCLECWEDIEPQYQMSSSGSGLRMAKPPVAFGPAAPELPYRPQNYGQNYKTRTAPNQTLSGPGGPGHRNRNMSNQSSAPSGGRGEVNINSYSPTPKRMEDKAMKSTNEHLEQQLRGLYVGPDKSDSSPTYRTPPEEFPPQVKRSKCQRPGGCPDGMFGDPAKKNLCSICWTATQRASSADQGKYGDRNYQHAHGPATPPRHTGRKDHDMAYSGRADSGYQNSQEALRYPEGGNQMERGFRQQEGWKEGTYQTGRGGLQREGYQSGGRARDVYQSGGGRPRDVYQSGGGRLRDENQSEPADNHMYEELDQLCAQPGCHRPAAENVEKFCDQCHENYKAIFLGYRQINEPGPPGQ